VNINRWTLVEHTGTHMDAPLHFTVDGHSVNEIPVTDFCSRNFSLTGEETRAICICAQKCE